MNNNGYNILDESCPSRRALDVIAEKWVVLVIHALANQKRRYSELEQMIGGISQKMLTQTLRRMEMNGLVSRTVFPVVPPLVEYELTPLGRTLLEPIWALKNWAETYLGELAKARLAHEEGERESIGK